MLRAVREATDYLQTKVIESQLLGLRLVYIICLQFSYSQLYKTTIKRLVLEEHPCQRGKKAVTPNVLSKVWNSIIYLKTGSLFLCFNRK